MKNRATPLAAALILAASAANAQTTTSGGSVLSFGSSASHIFNVTSAPSTNSDPDWIFKCGTPPFLACTTAELNLRGAVLANRTCPPPASTRCADYLMRNPPNPLENYSASSVPDGFIWSSPTCTRIPCRIEPTGATPADKSTSKQPLTQNDPGFIGPPDPRANTGPQPYKDDASFNAAMKVQEEATPGKVIDLGDRRYAVDDGQGNYSLGGLQGGYPVSVPTTADKIPGLKDAIQAKKANEAMFTNTAAGNNPPSTPSTQNGGRSGGGNVGGGRDDGAVVANAQNQANGGRGSVGATGTTGSGGGGKGGAATGGAGNPDTTISIDGNATKVGDIPVTFVHNQGMQSIIQRAASASTNGQVNGLVGGNGEIGGTVSGRLKEPPVDAKVLGKQQFEPQSTK